MKSQEWELLQILYTNISGERPWGFRQLIVIETGRGYRVQGVQLLKNDARIINRGQIMKALGFNDVKFELYYETNKKLKYGKDKKKTGLNFEILET